MKWVLVSVYSTFLMFMYFTDFANLPCLGKTIQTIALLAHLACEKGSWGPHLIVVPTSVILNWEYELKKWCPAFKLLTYFGSLKERKLKRIVCNLHTRVHVCSYTYEYPF